MKMKKPEKHKTTHFIFGVDVKDKDIVDVPQHLVSLFKAEGFEEVKEKINGRKKK
ncbi:hypothetical protein [Hydrogenivirga sp. 128-5-R1-1]|uniref:hypothetical protein n=1 Tax=Hydrogenivirga sp. 128-5-R1-1 TaxID=392423 RepID=UPI00015EF6F7|nr:hypothetical protein [Hydrogenivirga sp. 128-5-R1-1]EDP74399.1 hypothetical protein HG1285_12872 [Hydrogenivirga sp. 128-5-R1-1]